MIIVALNDISVCSQFKNYNPAFTEFEIWFRLMFLLTAFGIMVKGTSIFTKMLFHANRITTYIYHRNSSVDF